MRSIMRKLWRTGVIANLLTGSVVLLPLMLTVLIIRWIVGNVAAALGPGTWFGDLLTSGGEAVVGQNRETIAFLIGVSFALAGLWFLGVLVRAQARRAFAQTIDDILTRIPLFRFIYRPVSQVVRLFTGRGKEDMAGMSVVICRLGGDQGADILGLLTTQEVFVVGGDRRLMVYLPTSPLPLSGGLVLVPESAVIPLANMDADAVLKVYFSLGALAPEVMPLATRS
jgi:uncharacterized membrane protein